MKNPFKNITMGYGIAAVVTAYLVCHITYLFYDATYQSGYQAGQEHGTRVGYSEGSKLQKDFFLKERLYEDIKQQRDLREVWQEILFFDEKRRLYFTNLADPKLFPEPMTYIWTDRGCYAFKPNDFTFEEVYEFLLKRPAPEPEKWHPPAKFL